MKLSVSILNWNNAKTLKDTLDLLLEELKSIDFEIVIVDNCSSDDSLDLFVQYRGLFTKDQFKLILNDDNIGISKGKNQGIDACSGEYIFMLDADVWPVKNSLALMIEYLDNHPECQAIGAYPNKWSKQYERDCEFRCHTLSNPQPIKRACIYYGLFRREVFDKVRFDESGPFGEQGYGWEDLDFYEQMKQAGIEQWVAGINKDNGRYYHAINSSFVNPGCMTHNDYVRTSKIRGEYFKQKWNEP